MRPFLKWVGGKAAFVSVLTELLPADIATRRHVEPFVGGGAFFFAREPQNSVLSDVNPDLIATYRAVRDHVGVVIAHLHGLAEYHSKDQYYAVREAYNGGTAYPPHRAAQFIYLNKTCFNGVYRVNSKGEFNVPIGSYENPFICDEPVLKAASTALQKTLFLTRSFEALLEFAGATDFVYMDPPYDGTFGAYVKGGFDTDDQIKLAEVFRALDKRGAKVMLSNSATDRVRELYRGYSVTELEGARSLGGKGASRQKAAEVVVRNYE